MIFMTKKHIPVVGAAIIEKGKVLCTQRNTEGTLPNMWEFPGGKIEKDETKEQTLHREIGEELGIQIHILEHINENDYEYEFGIVHFSLFSAEISSGEINLLVHKDAKWVPISDLDSLNWAPVDIPGMHSIKERYSLR